MAGWLGEWALGEPCGLSLLLPLQYLESAVESRGALFLTFLESHPSFPATPHLHAVLLASLVALRETVLAPWPPVPTFSTRRPSLQPRERQARVCNSATHSLPCPLWLPIVPVCEMILPIPVARQAQGERKQRHRPRDSRAHALQTVCGGRASFQGLPIGSKSLPWESLVPTVHTCAQGPCPEWQTWSPMS